MNTIIEQRTQQLMGPIKSEFDRLNNILGTGLTLETKIMDSTLWITIRDAVVAQSITVPLTHMTDAGVELITHNDVTRVVCDYWIEKEQLRLNYYDIVKILICDDINRIMVNTYTDQPLISKIIRSFKTSSAPMMVSTLQSLINKVVNEMPLHETDMNSWAMHKRLVIIDPAFERMRDPNEKLEYQVGKNRKYYSMYGWTSIGLSDNTLADSNNILTVDLRNFTPFGMYHNPQRNLYSTLCMKGDELPKVRTKSMQELIDKGISRKGWNLTTAILDTPLNFEDQILVDKRHMSKFHQVKKKYIIYGTRIFVKKGDEVKFGDVLGISNDKTSTTMRLICEDAKVVNVRRAVINVGGEEIDSAIINIEGRRFLKEGSKFSNLHGNKGIIKFMDLGNAIDPRDGSEVPIDVMISAKSVEKRKNFGQILEALSNNINKDKEYLVISDDLKVNMDNLRSTLTKNGFPNDGVWRVNTYCGEYEAVVGKMFWGVTKDPEDQLWHDNKTASTDNREIRTSGLAFSHVEMKALVTHFGPGNPICKEILSHAQGTQNVKDYIRIIKGCCNEFEDNYPEVDASIVGYVDSSKSIFHTLDAIKGSVLDEDFMPNGFILKLPVSVQAISDKAKRREFIMSVPQEVNTDVYESHIYNKVFIPNSMLRRCWHHANGKWGLSVVGNLINNVVKAVSLYSLTKDVMQHIGIVSALDKYFRGVARILGGKNGEISDYTMGVRYPHSSRATVSLSESLPENTIEIYEDMARSLGVKTGDVVIAERFPCLGFVSIRPQYVKVSRDPQCKYVIRASGNSLVSMNLDFDGDTLFIASFKTPKAITMLRNYMKKPDELCDSEIRRINGRKVPCFNEMTFDDFHIIPFMRPSVDEQAELVRKATGVKSHTGPVIALAYNLMRMVEANVPYTNQKAHVELELLLDFLGNTVFKQKHGIKSLQEEATDAICTGNTARMVELGFKREPSELLCNLIRSEAASTGIRDIVWYHNTVVKEQGGSKIINRIVRMKNRLWFASRSVMNPFKLNDHLKDKAVDLPSMMMHALLKSDHIKASDILKHKEAERNIHRANTDLSTSKFKVIAKLMLEWVDNALVGEKTMCTEPFKKVSVLV